MLGLHYIMRKPTDDNPEEHDGDGEEEESVQRGEPGGHGCRLLFVSRHDPQLHDLKHIFVEESVLLPNDVKLNYHPEKSPAAPDSDGLLATSCPTTRCRSCPCSGTSSSPCWSGSPPPGA